ncbi:glucoamylase family protein [Thiomonas sp. FB-Cd]|uniref:glucoamylase family protein n=1 Tax=Thiomonas sp. FB-Cd TaxID=1158292 RepID=UPI0009DD891D|nr:glucoamylase family protein [Thiomonas sp. FB-Cd]
MMHTSIQLDAAITAEAMKHADATMFDSLQQAAFNYFPKASNPRNGLVADTTRQGSPASIAVAGFALSSYPVAVEHGWIERDAAVQACLSCMRFFWNSDQTGSPEATGYQGFYFHFLDMETGVRVWQSELSLIDTALLIAGMLTAAAYFDASTPAEVEMRELADRLYRRVNWRWAQYKGATVAQGWKPECGFLHYGWEGYSEAILLYALGLGSPTHPFTAASFEAWTVTYQWENLYGYDFLYAGPLFIHQFSHAWIDFRGIRDRFMREKRSDYFENSRRATYVQREYAIRNPHSFIGYADNCWGLSAGEGPSAEPRLIGAQQQRFFGYAARGVPYGPDDGTIAGPSITASLVFAPEIALPAMRNLFATGAPHQGEALRSSGINASFNALDACWISEGEFGLDQGMTVLMIENYRSGLLWELGRQSRILQTGLRRAGFKGGWL